MISPSLALKAASYLGASALGALAFNGLVYQPHLKLDARAETERADRALEVLGRVQALEHRATQISIAARDRNDQTQEAIRVVTLHTKEAVKVYVPAQQRAGSAERRAEGQAVGSGDPLLYAPLGFARLLDYAALGVDPPVPAPTGIDLTGPSGIELPAVAEGIVSNYGLCLGWRQEVLTWRGWYRDQSAAWAHQEEK